jgi:hypothetical protein
MATEESQSPVVGMKVAWKENGTDATFFFAPVKASSVETGKRTSKKFGHLS